MVLAGGHASGNIFTWDMSRPAKPFLHIAAVDRRLEPETDGHGLDVPVLHLGFLSTRHTALVSADDKGMAFSHLATRGLGALSRSVKTTRILGRYPDDPLTPSRLRKPSSVLAFSPLPLGNAEHSSDTIGLVAMLTPYLLVIVSTTPIAQTQFKTPRPKEVAAHGAMSATLAWFPSVKLKSTNTAKSGAASRIKLVYAWSNILTVLEVSEVEPSEAGESGGASSLLFRPRSRWRAQEAIVGLQWLSRSVLAVLTITQQLVILDESTLQVTDSSDLIQKHIYHADLFSQQLNPLVNQLEGEDASMHGVVADAFYMSFRAYKGRIFLLGFNEVSTGTISNWADRLLALMEQGNFIGAIRLATLYYLGDADKATVGLPENNAARHRLVGEKVIEMMSASLKYSFGKNVETGTRRVLPVQLEMLATACVTACIGMAQLEFLFEDVYTCYHDGGEQSLMLEVLEPHIMSGEIEVLPPTVIKDLTEHYMSKGLEKRLEDMICNLDSHTMDIDQISSLCKKNHLYDALLYVWNEALGDYTSPMLDLLDLGKQSNGVHIDSDAPSTINQNAISAKLFPYLSYILTSRVYPTGRTMPEEKALLAKAEIYHVFFSGRQHTSSYQAENTGTTAAFPNLGKILNLDAASFLSMLNEAFEDAFLNGCHDRILEEKAGHLSEEQAFGLSVNRQYIIRILLEVMTPPHYEPEDTVYLDMFIARNLPKFPQFILLPGHTLHRVLVGLCKYPAEELAEDCQLSVEYLLSIYQPPDLQSLIPLITEARFYRVLKSIYRTDRQYAKLLHTYFDDSQNPDAVFDCIGDCLRPRSGLSEDQVHEVKEVMIKRAGRLVTTDVRKAALTIDEYSPDLHGVLLNALEDNDGSQFEYLQTILDPSDDEKRLGQHVQNRGFTEQYVRLLCTFNPRHVTDYVERLKTGDLRLNEVLPALESSGVIDAAVVLMARDGKVREAIDRLTQHLGAMESALLGLLNTLISPDVANSLEAAGDLVEAIQRYTRVGIWLCQGQTKLAQRSKDQSKKTRRSKSVHKDLSMDENFWLDLIDAVVAVTKNITEVLENQGLSNIEGNDEINNSSPPPVTSRLAIELRKAVQETFTALLAATSNPHANEARRQDVSFLRILRAFLTRASLSSPSLSNIRAVLATIFSAYAYEESLLSLANRLLDKDLFVHVAEADTLRRRGWRPLGQVCEGCGARLWGPGAGAQVWEAWQKKNEEREHVASHRKNGGQEDSALDEEQSPLSQSLKGKGKGPMRDNRRRSPHSSSGPMLSSVSKGKSSVRREVPPFAAADEYVNKAQKEEDGAVAVFACRHIFHRRCLREMQQGGGRKEEEETEDGQVLEFSCPLCTTGI